MQKYKFNVMKWNLEKYNSTPLFYQKFQILLLMENANTHLVSIFKDYLLFDDMTEFLKEFYNSIEIYPQLRTIYDYYESSSYLFPNYTAINEGKYIYRNIIEKQKLIDYLEDLEDKKKEKEEKKNQKKNQNEQSSSSCIEVFDTKVYDNIRKETGNDSKINELFCVENKNNNDGDSFASIIKLTEMIKENAKDKIKEKIKVKNEDKKNKNVINNKNKNNNKEDNNNYNNNNKSNNSSNIIINKDYYIINKDNNNSNLNESESKIYVSRKPNINKGSNNSTNNNINNKKYIQKPEANININNFMNNNNSTNNNINNKPNKNINFNLNTNTKRINYNWSNLNKNLTSEPNKSNNDLNKNSQSQKNNNKHLNSNKNTYKKNNIIINIINNNKNNNYNYNNNYFSNYTSGMIENINKNNINLNNDNYFSNINNTNENNTNNNNDYMNNVNKNNNSTKNKNNYKLNINNNNIKPNNNNILIKGQISSKGLTVKNSTINRNSKNIIKTKIQMKSIKSKLLTNRLNTELLEPDTNLIRNLTERIKKQSLSNSMKKGKDQYKIKSVLSPRKNMKKRTKTEILGEKNDTFLFGQQNDLNINTYNKSINRQILKNINLTNSNKPKKDISLVNKKILNYHFNINNNLNNNCKTKIKNRYIKHSSTNSQNLTSIGIISKMSPLQIKDIVKKKGVIFSFNKTERSSRNHSKDKINKINNTTVKRNFLDSFSPKKSQELIYNKIHKVQNKNNTAIICSFLKSVNSNKKIKNLKIKRKANNSNFNSVNCSSKNKEYYNKINSNL